MNRYPSEEITFKLCLLGEAVGKTQLYTRLIKKRFTTEYKTTIGADFEGYTYKQKETTIRLQVWDFGCGDQEQFMKDAQGLCFCFDVKTFMENPEDQSQKLLVTIRQNLSSGSSLTRLVIIGCRSDLVPADQLKNVIVQLQALIKSEITSSPTIKPDIFLSSAQDDRAYHLNSEASALVQTTVRGMFESIGRGLLANHIQKLPQQAPSGHAALFINEDYPLLGDDSDDEAAKEKKSWFNCCC